MMLKLTKYLILVLFCFDANCDACEYASVQEATCDSIELFKQGEGQQELKKLTITENSFQQLEADFFKIAPQLLDLKLERVFNKIDKNTFRGLTKLKSLHLQDNHIEELPAELFSGLINLKNIIISNSSLEKLTPHIFDGLPKLELILLNDNKITEIPSSVFKQNKNINQISIGNNQITTIEDCAFCGMNNLDFLILHTNNLTQFEPERILGPSNIKGIGLDENRLTKIPRFDNTPELTGLSVNHNQISTIEENSFVNCKKLQLLEFGFNQLKSIPANILPDFDETEEGLFLILHNNQLQCLDLEVRNKIKKLRRITLEENLWTCGCLTVIMDWAKALGAAVSCETFQSNCVVSCVDNNKHTKNVTYENSG